MAMSNKEKNELKKRIKEKDTKVVTEDTITAEDIARWASDSNNRLQSLIIGYKTYVTELSNKNNETVNPLDPEVLWKFLMGFNKEVLFNAKNPAYSLIKDLPRKEADAVYSWFVTAVGGLLALSIGHITDLMDKHTAKEESKNNTTPRFS